MRPIYIDRCFAMLHPAAGVHGVVICNTLDDEALSTYRPLVFLAERFAAGGCPTVRVDYYGAGDSAGEDGESSRFQAWLDSISASVRWLRSARGVRAVTLVGVRVGALIAAAAACEIEGVAALVLVAPVASGRRFLRELILRANAAAEIWKTRGRIDDGGWFEAHGLRIDRDTRDALNRLDVERLPRAPAPRALIASDLDNVTGSMLADKLRRRGTSAAVINVAGLDAMLRDPYENAVPHAAFAQIVEWHSLAVAAVPARDPADGPRVVGDDDLRMADAIETPVTFGPGNGLFGIFTRPFRPDRDAPAVLIANSGANPRSGNARGAVVIARWLATHGVASLRMDGAGTGDSPIETGERGRPYSADADRDLASGIDELCRRCAVPVLLLGMCSGAYHALRATYADRRVGGLMLVNLQKFVWHEGESLSVVQRTTFRTTRFYLRNLVSPMMWRRLFAGQINLTGITRALAGRAVRRFAAVADPAIALLNRGETQVGRVRRQVGALRQRGVPILFMLSGNDPGLDEVAEYFGARGRQLRRHPNVTFHLLEGADHTLSTHWARQAALELMGAFLSQHWGLPIKARAPEATPRSADAQAPATPWALVQQAALPGT
jgi:alpha-beta hydrolase superfamily lysophospholipase